MCSYVCLQICDFGFARKIGKPLRAGTPAYTSPESVRYGQTVLVITV